MIAESSPLLLRAKNFILSDALVCRKPYWIAEQTGISEPIKLLKFVIEHFILQARPFVRHDSRIRRSVRIEIDCSLKSNIKPKYLPPEDGSKQDSKKAIDNVRPILAGWT